jgi:hypothetical protein
VLLLLVIGLLLAISFWGNSHQPITAAPVIPLVALVPPPKKHSA